MYEYLQKRNQIIIDAVIAKAQKVCPESLALIAIGGSFANGDMYEKSDLDLLILINDEQGWQLGETFIQEDLMVGHDVYCTTWESLEELAEGGSPHRAKLLDSKIVYCADTVYEERLNKLREKAKTEKPKQDGILNEFQEAKKFYAETMLAESLSEVRNQAGNTLYYLTNALALLNGYYYKKGVRRSYEEFQNLPIKPVGYVDKIEAVVRAVTSEEVQKALTTLMKDSAALMPKQQEEPETEIAGTYEEMFSNWRNKMYLAARENNAYLAFMSMNSLAAMFAEDLGRTQYDVLKGYNPENLQQTAEYFDTILNEYLKEYDKAGINIKKYPTAEAWAAEYTGGEQ